MDLTIETFQAFRVTILPYQIQIMNKTYNILDLSFLGNLLIKLVQ